MRWLIWRRLDAYRDLGLLVLRVGLGAMMIGHGWPKLAGGVETWEKLGGAMAHLGITTAPAAWGLAASLSECVGGALLVLGLATRPAALSLAITMFVAFWMHFDGGDGFRGWSHAAEDGIAFLALVILGGGRYSLDERLR
ncbi:MAG: putative oxidoreductase [Myxococcota bacterium]|jgi:putative oxidoreductase